MNSHELFSASSAATWLECSWSAHNGVPEPPKKASTVAAAQAGTAAHIDVESGSVPEIELFLDRLEPGTLYRELRVLIVENCGGTTDLFNSSTQIATIIDAKFGKWDVDAYHNKQMLTYAAGLLPFSPAEWWRLVVYQPNGLDEEPWKQWIAHRSEIEAHRQRILRAVADRSAPKPGPHCRWCRAFQACPAMATDQGFLMGAVSRPVESLTTDELTRLLRMIRALGDMKEVYEEALATRFDAVLKPGRKWRTWNDSRQAAEFTMQHYGVQYLKPPSPAQLEKLGFEGKKYSVVGSHTPEPPLKPVY